jgi:general stress protein CsbA
MEKKKSPTQLASWFSVNLYRDDLEEIIEKLTETCKEVIIEDNEYRYDSLDDLFTKRGPNPKQLSINSREPYVIFNVKIKPRWTSLGTSGEGDNLVPYFYIKQLLESKKRSGLEFLLTGPQSTLFFLLIIGLVFIPASIRAVIPGWIKWTYIISLMVVSVTLGQLYNFGAFTKLSLKRKHEEPSFWARNKDELLRQLLSNLLAFGLGLLAAYFLFKRGMK